MDGCRPHPALRATFSQGEKEAISVAVNCAAAEGCRPHPALRATFSRGEKEAISVAINCAAAEGPRSHPALRATPDQMHFGGRLISRREKKASRSH
jgi:hypothetical protein